METVKSDHLCENGIPFISTHRANSSSETRHGSHGEVCQLKGEVVPATPQKIPDNTSHCKTEVSYQDLDIASSGYRLMLHAKALFTGLLAAAFALMVVASTVYELVLPGVAFGLCTAICGGLFAFYLSSIRIMEAELYMEEMIVFVLTGFAASALWALGMRQLFTDYLILDSLLLKLPLLFAGLVALYFGVLCQEIGRLDYHPAQPLKRLQRHVGSWFFKAAEATARNKRRAC